MAFSNYDSPNTIWFSAREQVELFDLGDSLNLDVHPDCGGGFDFDCDDVVALRDALTSWLDNG